MHIYTQNLCATNTPGTIPATTTRTSTPTITNTPVGTIPATVAQTSTATNTPTRTNTPVQPSVTLTAVPSNTPPPQATNTTPPQPTDTPPAQPTGTVVATDTPPPAATSTPTACAITFSDVPSSHIFYPFIMCLACNGVLNGYPDGTFRPDNNVTRGQIAKIVSNAAGWNEVIPPAQQTFQDVASSDTFWLFVERMALHDVIQGYDCGDPGEPCIGPNNHPYFRPGNPATRAQISKIVVISSGIPINTDGGPHFSDVADGSTFYEWIETLYNAGAIQGYGDGTFRPNNNATRGQTAKIVANIFFPECGTSIRK
jgi:S-layer homology domain